MYRKREGVEEKESVIECEREIRNKRVIESEREIKEL